MYAGALRLEPIFLNLAWSRLLKEIKSIWIRIVLFDFSFSEQTIQKKKEENVKEDGHRKTNAGMISYRDNTINCV